MWLTRVIILVTLFHTYYSLRTVSPPVIKLNNGASLRGSYLFTVRGNVIDSFLGIPYAQPPIGKRRFADPEPKWSWSGTRNAITIPSKCLQLDTGNPTGPLIGEEDCLYLNVYTPRNRKPSARLPVMVFFHGGSYVVGSSDLQIYNGVRLLDNDVVLVTCNYRLGPLGFLSTETPDASGNYGLKDQNLVLRWVKEFIKDFGGDPKNVVIFGEGAGAASVSLHMVSPKSSGLFHKAILQSGSYTAPWALVPRGIANIRAKRLGTLVGCPTVDNGELVDCLRDVDADDLIRRINDFIITPMFDPSTVFGPVIEPPSSNAFIDRHPDSYINCYGNQVPIIIGANSDEGLVRSAGIINTFSDEYKENFDRFMAATLYYNNEPQSIQDDISQSIRDYYFRNGLNWSRKRYQNLTDLVSDVLFFGPMERYLDERLSPERGRVADTYVYIYDHNGPRSASEDYAGGPYIYGVSHEDELQMLFPKGYLGVPARKRDEQMQYVLPKLWTDFAKTGDPTPSRSKITERWKRATTFPYRYVRIGSQYPISYKYRSKGRNRSSNSTKAVNHDSFERAYPHYDANDIDDDMERESLFNTDIDEDAEVGLERNANRASQKSKNRHISRNRKSTKGRYHSKGRYCSRSRCNLCRVYTKKGDCTILQNERDRFWSGFYI